MTDTNIKKQDYNIDFERIKELISKYEQIKNSGEIKRYNEETTKKDFILPLFEALGWNIYNRSKRNDSVSAEENISKKRVDYGFRINGIPKFFLEAKSLKEENIQNNSKYVTQAIDYAWMKSSSWAILTNFETIAVYNADWKESNYGNNLFFVLHPNDFLTDNRFLYLSKEAFENNELDKIASKYGKKQLKNPINKQLLQDMIHFREILSKDIIKNNQDKHLSQEDIDESVQRILDRLIFIRNAEDRELEENRLQSNLRQWSAKGKGQLVKEVKEVYSYFDYQYNSKLFAHHLCDDLYLDNEVLLRVIEGLNHSEDNSYRYDFSIIESDVLGNIYEQYLGNILKSTPKRAKLEESRTHRKEQGIYYTPSYIVDYIVKNTMGEYIKTHKPEEIRKVRILDPACGSGSFLIRAYKELENYWKNYYEKSKEIPKSAKSVSQTKFDYASDSDNLEFYSTKTEILKNNIFGVDLDPKAVEIAQLNLLLQISERKHRLPLLQNNIKVGNSLIDDPSVNDEAFKWEEEFPDIMKEGGFDIVIGNPPYGKGIGNELKTFTESNIKDTYTAFLIKSIDVIKNDGLIGFIIPVSWQTGEKYLKFREELFNKLSLVKIINLPYNIFEDAYVDTCVAIFKKDKHEVYYAYSFPKNAEARRLMDVENLLKPISMKSVLNDKFLKVFVNEEVLELIKKFNSGKYKMLGEISKSTIGVLASKYVIKENKEDDYLPFLEGNVYRYNLVVSKLKYIDMSSQKKDYLWYYEDKRILVRRIISRQDRIMATITDLNFVNKKDLYSFKLMDNHFSYEYILALLNSKLLSFLYVNSSTISTKDDFRQTTLAELRRLPIADADLNKQQEISNLVNKIIMLKKQLSVNEVKFTDSDEKIKNEIIKLESIIDETVYGLYSLTKRDIKIIEDYFNNLTHKTIQFPALRQ